jgi:pimeloyl-ACP methyl ester carboxylesterase
VLLAECEGHKPTSTITDHMSTMLSSKFFTTNDGVDLHYPKQGNIHENVLILLPDWTFSAAQFQAQMAAFSSTHRVVALDPRGHNESQVPDSGFRVSRMARDLDNMLDHLDVDQLSNFLDRSGFVPSF